MNSDQLNPMKRFWLLLKPDQKEIRNVYVYAIFNGLVYLTLPLGIQAIINLIQVGSINTSWIVLVSIVILGIAVNGLLTIYQLKITENLQQKIFARAAFEFAFRIPRLKLEALYNQYAPELMNRFFDIISVQKGLSKILMDFSTATVQVLLGLLLLSLYHPFFIVFSLVLVFLVFAVIRYTGKRGLASSLKESNHKYKIAYWLQELARANVTFKLSGKSMLPISKMDEHVTNYLGAREEHFKILVSQYYLMVLFKVLVATGLLAIGGVLVMEQQMNIGQFVASEIIVLLIMGAIEKLILSIEVIYDVLTSLEKIGQITDLDLESQSGIDMTNALDGKGMFLQLSNVCFDFDGRKSILNNLDLNIAQGEHVMIHTDDDVASTALMAVLAGLYQPTSGTITYNGLARGNIELGSLRGVIGDSLMKEVVFHGSILDNIAMGRKNMGYQEVLKAAKEVHLLEEVKELSQGFDTVINPESLKYSKMFIQKLLLARGIVDNPSLLLIRDVFESFNGLDRENVMNLILDKSREWTVIIESHNVEVAKRVDAVAVIKKGSIVAYGSYDEIKDLI